MDIRVNKKYGIKTIDERNVAIVEYYISKKTNEEKWKVKGYYGNMETLFRSFHNILIKQNEAKDINECLVAIEKATKTVLQAIKEYSGTNH